MRTNFFHERTLGDIVKLEIPLLLLYYKGTVTRPILG